MLALNHHVDTVRSRDEMMRRRGKREEEKPFQVFRRFPDRSGGGRSLRRVPKLETGFAVNVRGLEIDLAKGVRGGQDDHISRDLVIVVEQDQIADFDGLPIDLVDVSAGGRGEPLCESVIGLPIRYMPFDIFSTLFADTNRQHDNEERESRPRVKRGIKIRAVGSNQH
jgi:hypothetical protein